MTATTTGLRSAGGVALGGFGSALRAEWVKFRTVRGWSVALVTSVVLCVVFTYLVANGNHTGTCTGSGACTSGHAFVPTGPAGEAVEDVPLGVELEVAVLPPSSAAVGSV